MPYNGPAAPPTLEINVVATSFSTAPGVSGGLGVQRRDARR